MELGGDQVRCLKSRPTWACVVNHRKTIITNLSKILKFLTLYISYSYLTTCNVKFTIITVCKNDIIDAINGEKDYAE